MNPFTKLKEALMGAMLRRLLRSGIATGVGVLAAKYGNNDLYIAATPLLMAVTKWARAKWPQNEYVKLIPF